MKLIRIRRFTELNYDFVNEEEFNRMDRDNLAEYYIYDDVNLDEMTGINLAGNRVEIQ